MSLTDAPVRSTGRTDLGPGLQLRGLVRRFGDLTAVDDVSFDVPPGVMTGFVGGNGAGKTSTMRLAMGLLAADAGEVSWQGRPVTWADRTTFGYMPEERGLYPKQKVVDQLVYLGRLKGLSQTDARSRAVTLLGRFGLGDRTEDPLEKLSLGNQQRVQVIAAVISSPPLLVLDEPFSGLDPDAVDDMAELLGEHAAAGVPVLFSSHQLDLVDRLCDRLVVMAGGRVRAAGGVDELRAAAPMRWRLVLGGDAGWVRDHAAGVADLQVLDVEGSTALLDPPADPGSRDRVSADLLTEALRRGSVRELAHVVPTLSDIYREVTA
ncbi:ATP-binding cassette domain-containing protein [Nocardioidaceae bacterium]|nr:ATP-binding cassette domain-containing protein [Nocardioidaceae bacterium]